MFRFVPVDDKYGKTSEGPTIKATLDAAFDSARWYWDVQTDRGVRDFRFGFLDDQPVTASRFGNGNIVPVAAGNLVIGRLERLVSL